MWFEADNMVLTTVQAACVALPAAGVPRFLERFRGGAWALILPLCIVVVIVACALTPETQGLIDADRLADLPVTPVWVLGAAEHVSHVSMSQ